MATLEKIRSRSVLLTSIIFVALFLFIITIVDNPISFFVDQTSVAKVNGQKIDYEQYQQRANRLREQNPEMTNADEQALQALISEALFQQEFDKLGLAVTKDEVSNALVGENAVPYFVNSFRSQFGASPREVLEAIQNPEAYGLTADQVTMLSNGFQEFEDQIEQFLLGQKFFMLAGGTITANKLDARAAFDEGNTNYTLATVSKSIYSRNDSVTDADMKKYYKAHREEYKTDEPARYVKYAYLDITPSGADRMAAIQTVNDAVAELNSTEGTNALSGNSAFIVEHHTGNADAVKALDIRGLQAFLDTLGNGHAGIVENRAYVPTSPRIVVAKLNSREVKSNGAKVKRIVIDPTANVDSVIAAANVAANVDSVPGVIGSTEINYVFSEMPQVQVDTVRGANGKYVAFPTPQGTFADAIQELNAPETIYDFAVATYDVQPSRETLDALNTRMRDFMVLASTADQFNEENGAEQGISINDALVTASSASLGGLEDSRNIVAWAMDAKKGQVSRLYTGDGKNARLTVAAVADIYKDKYVPYTFPAIHQQVEHEALMEKRANAIIAETAGQGSSLADYQKIFEAATVDTLRNVNLSSQRYADLGTVRGHKAGDVVGPIRWSGNVIVYSIVDAQEGTMPYDETSNSMQYQRQMQQFLIGDNSLESTLLGDGKINNRILKFTRQ